MGLLPGHEWRREPEAGRIGKRAAVGFPAVAGQSEAKAAHRIRTRAAFKLTTASGQISCAMGQEPPNYLFLLDWTSSLHDDNPLQSFIYRNVDRQEHAKIALIFP
jgi:hypothetical protein